MKKIYYFTILSVFSLCISNTAFSIPSSNTAFPDKNSAPVSSSISTLSDMQKTYSKSVTHKNRLNAPDKKITRKRVDLVKVLNDPVKGEELLEKMKKNIMDQLNRKIENDPNNIWALLTKGWALNSEGKYDKAIECFVRALKIQEEPAAYMGLGMAYIRKGDLQKADQCYMKALEQQEAKDTYYLENSKLSPPSVKLDGNDMIDREINNKQN